MSLRNPQTTERLRQCTKCPHRIGNTYSSYKGLRCTGFIWPMLPSLKPRSPLGCQESARLIRLFNDRFSGLVSDRRRNRAALQEGKSRHHIEKSGQQTPENSNRANDTKAAQCRVLSGNKHRKARKCG